MLMLPDFKEKQIIFIFASRGEKLSFKNDNIIVRDRDNKIVHQSTCYKLFSVYIVGNFSITSGLLQRSKKFGFTLILMTQSLRVYSTWGSAAEGNFLLREKQYNYNSTSLATHIIRNKISNQVYLLKKIRKKSDQVKETIERMSEFKNRLLDKELDTYKILGLEGIASREYFKILFHDCNWTVRRPRVKHDPINSLQDTGYTIYLIL